MECSKQWMFILVLELFFVATKGLQYDCSQYGAFQTASWEFPPLVYAPGSQENISGSLYNMAESMISRCCQDSVPVEISWFPHARAIEESIDDLQNMTFFLPISRAAVMGDLDKLIPRTTFIPVLETPGPLLMMQIGGSSFATYKALLGSWPLFLVVVMSSTLAAIIIWILDRGWNPSDFPAQFSKGLAEGMWWSCVTMTTVGYGDKTPRSVIGRIFGVIWMLAGIIILGFYTSTITTALTAESNTVSDMRGMRLGVLNGSETFSIAIIHGATPVEYGNIQDLLDACTEDDDMDAILLDTFWAFAEAEILSEYDIFPTLLVDRPAVHGIVVKNIDEELLGCFAETVIKKRHKLYYAVQGEMGEILRRKEVAAHNSAFRLSQSHLIALYIMTVIVVCLFMILVLWECLYWKPRQSKKSEKEQETADYRPEEHLTSSKVHCQEDNKSENYTSHF